MNFWDTKRGWMLADTLIRELPKLNKKQHSKTIPKDKLEEVIAEKLHDNLHVDHMVDLGDKVLVIFS